MRIELTLCANRSCCRLRPVRDLEKDAGEAKVRVAGESARCIFIRPIEEERQERSLNSGCAINVRSRIQCQMGRESKCRSKFLRGRIEAK